MQFALTPSILISFTICLTNMECTVSDTVLTVAHLLRIGCAYGKALPAARTVTSTQLSSFHVATLLLQIVIGGLKQTCSTLDNVIVASSLITFLHFHSSPSVRFRADASRLGMSFQGDESRSVIKGSSPMA